MGLDACPWRASLRVIVDGRIECVDAGIPTLLRHDLGGGRTRRYPTSDGFDGSMYQGLATQYLRRMRDFRYGDDDAARHAPAVAGTTSSA